jgi:hypothetical protein
MEDLRSEERHGREDDMKRPSCDRRRKEIVRLEQELLVHGDDEMSDEKQHVKMDGSQRQAPKRG